MSYENCNAKVKQGDGTFKQCSQKGIILGLCITHYTMVAYGRNITKNTRRKEERERVK